MKTLVRALIIFLVGFVCSADGQALFLENDLFKFQEDDQEVVFGYKSVFSYEKLIFRKNYKLNSQGIEQPHIYYAKNIKGIYINEWVSSNSKRMADIFKEIEESKLNAIVLDLKDVRGRITFSKDQKDVEKLFSRGLRKIVEMAHKKGIYVIGRLTVFKDPVFIKNNPSEALEYVLTEDGQTIVKSDMWSSPYSKEVWRYNLKIAEQAVKLGIDEVQFDYVRFPTLALNSKLAIKLKGNKAKDEAIVDFLKYAKSKLDKYNILISADVFGLTTTVDGDLSIGQDIIKIAECVDYVSPMIYPSHYSAGFYGVVNPDANPYDIIYRSLKDAKLKLKENSYKLRPWLQDFSLAHKYRSEEIRDQVKAVNDNRVSGWLLWNPRSAYTMGALKDENRGEKNRWNSQGSELFQKQ